MSKTDLTKKSVQVIKNLQLKNGGILSTPLNGAYPYIYPRDAVIMTRALNLTGNVNCSERFYHFMNKITKLDNYGEVFHRYNPDGLPAVTRKKEQDNEGLVLWGVYDTYLHNKKETFIENLFPLIEKIVKIIFNNSKTGLVRTERSIHEFYRLERGEEIWANCACCKGLYDAAKIAKILGHDKESKNWRQRAEVIEKNIKKRLFNKKLGMFIKNPRFPAAPDMSQLAPFYFEIEDSKKKLRKTMNYLKKHIWDKDISGFRRFRKFEICEDWHWYTGGSGSWCAFTAWGAKFYYRLGDEKGYKECISWLHKVGSMSNGLLPEHIATKEEYDAWKSHETEFNSRIINETKKTEKSIKKFKDKKIAYWATPLGWSHAEYILLKNHVKKEK